MRFTIILLATLSCNVNVKAENLIRWLLTNTTNKTSPVDKYEGVTRERVGNTPFYIYRMKKKSSHQQPAKPADKSYEPMTESEKQTARIAVAQQQARIASHADNKPIKRVIDKHRESDEAAANAVSVEKRTIYGSTSPLRDDGVIDAWKEAEAAQRRLEEHRTYMEQIRQARLRVEQAKTVSGDIN